MKNGKIQIGIVGCGGIANGKHFPALAKLGDICELVAFCDIIPERAEKAAKEYGIPGAKVYTDYHDLLQDEKIDEVHVLTPNVSHCEITCAALEAGKHVLCEKPMAATPADAHRMLEAYHKSGKLLTIGYQNRFRDDSLFLKEYCEKDGLGEIYFAKAYALRRRGVPTWGVFTDKSKQGGGPLIDIGTHSLDLALWCMYNYKPRTVLGVSYEKLGRLLGPNEQGNGGGSWDNTTYDVEDSAFGYIVMENGASIFLQSSWALNIDDSRQAKITLCGTKAGSDMNDGLRINTVMQNKQTMILPNTDTYRPGTDLLSGFGVAADRESEAWLGAILGRNELVVKPEQAIVVTEILDAIYRSSAQKAAINF